MCSPSAQSSREFILSYGASQQKGLSMQETQNTPFLATVCRTDHWSSASKYVRLMKKTSKCILFPVDLAPCWSCALLVKCSIGLGSRWSSAILVQRPVVQRPVGLVPHWSSGQLVKWPVDLAPCWSSAFGSSALLNATLVQLFFGLAHQLSTAPLWSTCPLIF